jgi:hypothetical protein
MYLGKKVYQSRAIGSVRLTIILLSFILLLNLFFQTMSDPHFLERGDNSLASILSFHWFYPQEIIIYLLTVLIPTLYYSFIRGVRFFEKGVIYNKGLPFFNSTILYRDIEKYEVVHPKYLLAITEKETKDAHLFSISQLDRVVALLDQSGIKGDLGSYSVSDHSAKKKLILLFFIFGVFTALIQYSGVVRYLFR